MNFSASFDLLMKAEGGYSNNKFDSGGYTLFGITRKNHPKSPMWEKVDKWTAQGLNGAEIAKIAPQDKYFMDFVKAEYRGHYWAPCKCDELRSIYCYPVFNCAVNLGVRQASKLFQRALGVTADGFIGNITIATAYRSHYADVLDKFYELWRQFYDDLIAKKPKNEVFRKGWYNRIENVKKQNYA